VSDIQLPPIQRAQAESEFYNRYARQLQADKLAPLDVFAPTCLENRHLLAHLGDLKGKRVLDIGCGQGDTSVWFALRGAEVWALDVSDQMVKLTGQLAVQHGVGSAVHADVGRVEDMTHPDNFFDLVFADGVLHHIDMRAAVPNIVRVLKPGGRGYFFEPQKGSLFIQIYRFFARDLRTLDERPLEQADFQFLQTQFGGLLHDEYHFVSLPLFALRFLLLKLTGRAFPYWMDEVRQGKFSPRVLAVLQWTDDRLLRLVPSWRKFCWLTLIRAEKRPAAISPTG
jgi:SAM-dependent methyltransferase